VGRYILKHSAVLTFQAFRSFTKIPGNQFVARWADLHYRVTSTILKNFQIYGPPGSCPSLLSCNLQYLMCYLAEMSILAFPPNGDLLQKNDPDCFHQCWLSKDSPGSFLNPEKIKLLSRMDHFNLIYWYVERNRYCECVGDFQSTSHSLTILFLGIKYLSSVIWKIRL